MEKSEVRKTVRREYGKIAKKNTSCCGDTKSGSENISKAIGYTKDELDSIPTESILGLGCGNPTAIASLKEGETVVDLGSGGGLDVFLSSTKIGSSGRVIGVDMTPNMIDLARNNAEKNNITNVEFRLGEIENLPVANNHADVIISNCVINLSPEKQRVFDEAYRVLKPGGRLSISDIVLLKPLPESVRSNKKLLAACVAGAELKDVYLGMIEKAGFKDIQVLEKKGNIEPEIAVEKGEGKSDLKIILDGVEVDIDDLDEDKENLMALGTSVQSITVTAFK
ncbi:MAG: arsenite methyltransferase [Candidatus Heimdallarchaeota archaeon]|nr:arsenite methyltransferase [Candidatus Heimdallarchaeota archaeon]